MAGYDDTWQAWFKGPSGEYVECNAYSYRNVIGSALSSIAWDASAYGNDIPVVLRYEVTGVNGTSITFSRRTILVGDSGYSVTTPQTLVAGADSVAFSSATIVISTGTQIGDIFEIGAGYYWDETTASWISQRAFGIIPHGEFGNIHTMKLKNISGGGIAYVAVGWSNEGTQIITARQKDIGVWKSAAEAPVLLAGADGVPGYMADDEEVEVEFRPQVPDAATTENNPLTITVVVSGESI